MRRHATAHLEPGLHRLALGKEALRLGSMVDRLVRLSDLADTILTEALSDHGDRRVALAAIRETRELVAMLTRLVSPDTAETVEEAQRLVSALARVLSSAGTPSRRIADDA
jgi:hypothetical protein